MCHSEKLDERFWLEAVVVRQLFMEIDFLSDKTPCLTSPSKVIFVQTS